MVSLLKRLATVPTLLIALAVCGPLTLFFLLNVPDRLARPWATQESNRRAPSMSTPVLPRPPTSCSRTMQRLDGEPLLCCTCSSI
jgi:hypothetical protein